MPMMLTECPGSQSIWAGIGQAGPWLDSSALPTLASVPYTLDASGWLKKSL